MSTLQRGNYLELFGCASCGFVVTTIVWEGGDKFSRFLRETPGIVVKDVEAALKQEGENAMGVSKRRTPVDLGPLRASAHVKLPETKGGVTSVTLAYGTDYAVYVHEIVTTAHTVGQAKFLESSVKDAAKGFGDRMQKKILDRIGKRR